MEKAGTCSGVGSDKKVDSLGRDIVKTLHVVHVPDTAAEDRGMVKAVGSSGK